jgi:hypothetical protein
VSIQSLSTLDASIRDFEWKLAKKEDQVCRLRKNGGLLEMGMLERTACKQQLQMELASQNSETVSALKIESQNLEKTQRELSESGEKIEVLKIMNESLIQENQVIQDQVEG